MLFERIVSKGLAHYSYLVGDKDSAVAIDPRRDFEIYIEKAASEGMKIARILETHRNEDYFVGSSALAQATGAEIWHADDQWEYEYGRAAEDGQRWKIGRLEIEALHTPGHTPGSMSYLLRDADGISWILFSGDALFAGDVGRTDLLGRDRAIEMAGLLYESIFSRLFPLGDDVIVCPAHGAGSVCGESIADRLWTAIGIERKHNPRLQVRNKDEFVSNQTKTQPEKPPYFNMMEKVNLEGEPLMERLPTPNPLSPQKFEALAAGAQVLDTRTELGFSAAHVPGSQFIWADGLASFAGWYLSYDQPILLLTEGNNPEEVVRILIRERYDNIAGYLSGGMLAWHMSGKDSRSLKTVTVQEFCRAIDQSHEAAVLDVRSDEELLRNGRISGAQHIHVTQIPERHKEVSRDQEVYIFCGSGMRSTIAASYLEARGWENLAVILGGLSGWKSVKCPVVR
ncbi:MAG: MBL fold metallo-hydrolase [Methanotrichaceae archaeon]|nr:MBL fold metallo-hydrolase [Methanotrichaceae archaeon]